MTKSLYLSDIQWDTANCMGKNHHNNKLFFRLLILIAIILAGYKDGPFSTSENLVDTIYGRVDDSRFPPRYDWPGSYFYDKPINGAQIYIDGELVTSTNNAGKFSISGLRRTTYEITIEHPGYVTNTDVYNVGNTGVIEIFPAEIQMIPILEEYYVFEMGSYWVYDYYHKSSSHGDFTLTRTGEYSWEVVNVHQENQVTWYELIAELEYEEHKFDNWTDSTYIQSVRHIETHMVRGDDWRYLIKNSWDDEYNKFVLSNSFIRGSPDEITEIKPKVYHPNASFDTRKVYLRAVGLIFREYTSRSFGSEREESWTLIDSGKR